jgi:hypothetical protein
VPTFLLIPLVVLAVLVVVMGVFVFLGRFRGGRYLQKLIVFLARFSLMRRFFTWSQKRMMERQNPELASVMRKLERLGSNPDPRAAQQVISRFTRAEKKAYDDYLAIAREQGALPEAPNRQARRQQQRMAPAAKPAGTGKTGGTAKPGGSTRRAGKRRR